VKARKVSVDPDAPFGAAIDRILAVRLGELDSFAKAVQSPKNVAELHDMRIAAKRVRYVLELAEPVHPGAKSRAKAARRLQDLLGEIHDCDELLPLVRRHVKRLRDEDAAAAAAGELLPNRRKYRGLEALRAHTIARRAALHERFVVEWPKLRAAVGEHEAVAA
jgi:CHAD domain-containing protein